MFDERESRIRRMARLKVLAETKHLCPPGEIITPERLQSVIEQLARSNPEIEINESTPWFVAEQFEDLQVSLALAQPTIALITKELKKTSDPELKELRELELSIIEKFVAMSYKFNQ